METLESKRVNEDQGDSRLRPDGSSGRDQRMQLWWRQLGSQWQQQLRVRRDRCRHDRHRPVRRGSDPSGRDRPSVAVRRVLRRMGDRPRELRHELDSAEHGLARQPARWERGLLPLAERRRAGRGGDDHQPGSDDDLLHEGKPGMGFIVLPDGVGEVCRVEGGEAGGPTSGAAGSGSGRGQRPAGTARHRYGTELRRDSVSDWSSDLGQIQADLNTPSNVCSVETAPLTFRPT